MAIGDASTAAGLGGGPPPEQGPPPPKQVLYPHVASWEVQPNHGVGGKLLVAVIGMPHEMVVFPITDEVAKAISDRLAGTSIKRGTVHDLAELRKGAPA